MLESIFTKYKRIKTNGADKIVCYILFRKYGIGHKRSWNSKKNNSYLIFRTNNSIPKGIVNASNYAEFKKNYWALEQMPQPEIYLLKYYLMRNYFAHKEDLNHDSFFSESDRIYKISQVAVKVLADIY
ncbi:MAG: hypothetical protein HQL19_08690 [Candidatus Omnitrophica bacterium]|nr:hypothetical protein [Candidatus Omnitrophota bacterium]